MAWRNLDNLQSQTYICGFCGNGVASSLGFNNPEHQREIYVCPHCEQPTYVDEKGKRIPAIAPGGHVDNVPEKLDNLYHEARNCISVGAYTAAVLTCRKILMNIAVTQGAKEGMGFLSYIKFMANSGCGASGKQEWFRHIVSKGYEAGHEIRIMASEDAEELVAFIEMLLKFMYEFPARLPGTRKQAS